VGEIEVGLQQDAQREIQALRKQLREESKKREKEILDFKRVAREDVKEQIAASLRCVDVGFSGYPVTFIGTRSWSRSGWRSQHRSNSRSTCRFENRYPSA
jgi:hypothetical protein